MQKHCLMLTTSAFILACGVIAASAQQGPMTHQAPQSQQQQQQLERQGVHRRGVEDDRDQNDDRRGGRMMGRGWRGPGMMSQGGMMGPESMGSGMMMRMLFAMMDGDGDGTISLQEFQAAHERIFKGMDANKDGRLTLEEIQAFMQGTRRPVSRE